MHLANKKLLALLLIFGFAAVLQACDQASSSTGSGGSSAQVVDISNDEPATQEKSVSEGADKAVAEASAETPAKQPELAAAEPEPEPQPEPVTLAAAAAKKEPRDEFHLLMDQTHLACADCGLNFDSADLVIDHSEGRFKAHQSGSLNIKSGPYRQGRFRADLRSIPPGAEIHRATLYMRLNKHEGLASSDHSSEFVVKGYVGGNLIHVKDFTVQRDIKGRGYSKGLKPVVPFDYTDYVRKL